MSRVEKRYLLATKIFDTLCDSGENAAISWHHYNIRPLRLMLTFKLASTVDRETAKLFWECILEPNESKLCATLPAVCKGLQRNLEQIPDERSGQILGKALEWARINPLAIEIHTDRKLSRQGHFPNLVAFANLLDGLENTQENAAVVSHGLPTINRASSRRLLRCGTIYFRTHPQKRGVG